MIDMDSFKDAAGHYDWAGYHNARKAAGEECYTCGGYIVFAKGYRTKCYSCEQLQEEKREVTHGHYVRCPKCRQTMSVHDDNYQWYEEGTHDVSCHHCDHDFEITTRVEYSFTSPKLIDESKD